MTTVHWAELTGDVTAVWLVERVETGVAREACRLVATLACRRLISLGRSSIDDDDDDSGGIASDKEGRCPEQHLWRGSL